MMGIRSHFQFQTGFIDLMLKTDDYKIIEKCIDVVFHKGVESFEM